MKFLKDSGVELAGRKAVVIGRSTIVGLPVAKLLLDENATVTITHSRTKNLADVTREAEILVVAIGRPKFVTADMVGDGAVVIDVGVNRDPETGKLCGDVDFEACEPKASLITKVPGGVGPMTIACLIENTIEAFPQKKLRNRFRVSVQSCRMRTDCLDADYISISGADARFFPCVCFFICFTRPNCLFFVNTWEGRGPGGQVSADFAPDIK